MELTFSLSNDATIDKTKGGKKVIHFDLVHVYRYYSNDEKKVIKKKFYYHCTYWQNSGVAEYLKKGAVVRVTGYAHASAYLKDGKPTGQLQFHVDEIELISSPVSAQNANAASLHGESADNDEPVLVGEDPNDLPF